MYALFARGSHGRYIGCPEAVVDNSKFSFANLIFIHAEEANINMTIFNYAQILITIFICPFNAGVQFGSEC